jgi:hypothetical protein
MNIFTRKVGERLEKLGKRKNLIEMENWKRFPCSPSFSNFLEENRFDFIFQALPFNFDSVAISLATGS